jgi:hypothetical protein
MKQFFTLLFMLSLSALQAQFIYTFSTDNGTYTDLTGATSINNGEVWDDPEYVVDLPFEFSVNGHAISTLTFIGLGSELGFEIGDDEFATISPFGADIIDRGSDGVVSLSPISYVVEGNAPARVLKIEWKNAGSYDEFDALGTTEMFVNLQVWLFEGSNKIEYHYGPSSITDADLFYTGETGPIVGVVDIDFNAGYSNAHFLTGLASNPSLTEEESFLDGTPDNGMIYRFAIDQPLDVTVIGVNGNCGLAEGSATAIPSGGVEPYTYLWSNGATTDFVEGLEEGNYTVTVTDANSSTAEASVTIINGSSVNPNASATDETGAGLNDGTAMASPFGGAAPYTYLWSNGSTSQNLTGLAPGTYTVTVTDSEGCEGMETVTVNAFGCADLLLEAALSNISCFGNCDVSIAILEVVNGTAPFSYLWTTGETTSTIENLCAGIYGVTVTDGNGCIVSAEYEIFQPEELLPNASATGETSQGANDGTATASPSGGIEPYSYLWSNGSTDQTITGLIPGDYIVTVTDGNFCTAVQTVTVDAFGSCALEIQAEITNASCFGVCDGIITLTVLNATEPVEYFWSNGASTSQIIDLCAIDWSVTVTDADGCILTATYTVSQPAEIVVNGGATDETEQNGGDGTAWAAPTGGVPPYTYLWSTGSTDSLIVDLDPAEYFVTVTDASGCTAVQTLTVNPFTCVSLIESALVAITCNGACDGAISITVLDGVGPFTYLWNVGSTETAIDSLCAGTYSVSIYDAGQNCTGLAGFLISEPEALTLTVDEVVNITDSTIAAIAITAGGGTPPYAYAWTGPGGFASNAEDISGMDEGSYQVVVTDANGCTLGSASITVLDETVGVNDIEKLDGRIYPNPAASLLHVEINEPGDFEILMRTMDGKLIQSWRNMRQLDISAFPDGLYTFQCISGKKELTQRVVILK